MTSNPGFYRTGRVLQVKISAEVSAKLATYRREMHPAYTDEQVAAYLLRDALIGLGVMELPGANRSKGARGR